MAASNIVPTFVDINGCVLAIYRVYRVPQSFVWVCPIIVSVMPEEGYQYVCHAILWQIRCLLFNIVCVFIRWWCVLVCGLNKKHGISAIHLVVMDCIRMWLSQQKSDLFTQAEKIWFIKLRMLPKELCMCLSSHFSVKSIKTIYHFICSFMESLKMFVLFS